MTLQDVMAVGLDAPSAARFAPSIVGIVACSHYFVPGIESVKLAFSQALHASGPSKHAAGLRSASLRPPRAMLLSSFALIAPCLGAQVQVSPRGDPSFIAPPGLGPFGPVMSVAQPMTSTPAVSMAADSQSDVRAFQMTLPLDAGIRLDEWKLLAPFHHTDRPDGRARVQFGVVIGRASAAESLEPRRFL